jgi:hypothetical protein
LISILASGDAVDPTLTRSVPMPHKAEIALHDLHVNLASTSKYDPNVWIYHLHLYSATARIGSSENASKIGEAMALWSYLTGLGLKTDLGLGASDLAVQELDCNIDAEKPMSEQARFHCDLTIPQRELN